MTEDVGRRSDVYVFCLHAQGLPDKVADLIADRLLDAYLVHDPNAHVAIEVLVKNGSTSRGNGRCRAGTGGS